MAKVRVQQVRMKQQELHTPWTEGELITLQVTAVEGDGSYLCETRETVPPDIKERHATELAAKDEAHAKALKAQAAELAKEVPDAV